MNKGLKNKGLGSWFCLAAALVALITGIVFLLTQATAAPLGHSGTMAGVVLLVGAAASLVFFFVSVPFSALIQAVIYNIALYLVVVQLYFVFADVINHVTFAGGNAGLCVFYMVGTFIACLLSVIACFCKQTKTGEAKATGKQFAAAGAVVVVAAVCVGGFSLQSSSLPSADDAEVAPDAAQTSADGPVMYYNDNEYVSKTLDDLIAIPQETWEAKEPNGEVAYFFEGQYTEGFSTIVDPACLDMYCYTDGSMWGSFSGPNTSVGGDSISHVYGYWYNYDENGEKKLSADAYHFIAGLLTHVSSMNAILNPLVNSYKRLVPGYEAPCYTAWSASNRSALIRIPAARGQSTRVELRCPDPSCNPYLALAVCLAAGLDGIERKLTPPAEITENIFAMTPAEREAKGIHSLPGTLHDAVEAFRKDKLICDTLGEHIVSQYVAGKEKEWDEYRTHVSNWELEKYLITY